MWVTSKNNAPKKANTSLSISMLSLQGWFDKTRFLLTNELGFLEIIKHNRTMQIIQSHC